MKPKQCKIKRTGGVFKRTPSQRRQNILQKTLASKNKYLTEKNIWTTVMNTSQPATHSPDTTSSEEEVGRGRAIVKFPQRTDLQSTSSKGACSSSLTDVLTNESFGGRQIMTKAHLRFISESESAEDSDYVVNENETSVDSLDSSCEDETMEEEKDEDIEEPPDEEAEDVEDKLYVFESKDIVVAILRHPLEVVLCGQALVLPVSGTISIFGSRLDGKSPGPAHVFSSFKFAFLTIKTEELDRRAVQTAAHFKYVQYRLEQMGAGNLSDHVLSTLDCSSLVVALRRAPETGSVRYACRLASVPLFAAPRGKPFSFARPPFSEFGFTLAVNLSRKKWVLKEDQEQLADHITKMVLHAQSSGGTAPRVVICGGKNVGKSTFLRFLINKTLNVCEKICHLECDPGQTEFTPPGCVALTFVTEPLLGPPFTHSKAPERMCYVGGVTVENTPYLYISSVLDLIRHHRNHMANYPLFVNTMGWTTGLGLCLLVDILRYTQPTIVVRFDCGPLQSSHNLPELDTDFLRDACGWTSSRDMSTEAEFKVLSPPVAQTDLAASVMPAVNRRNLAIFSYMGHLQKPHLDFQPINSFTPFSVPWSAVAVHCYNGEVPPDEIMHAVNGNLVALCHVDSSKVVDSVVANYPKCLIENPENVCYGFGLVRGIDHRKKLFLVITPEKLSTLKNVNALLVGSGGTPEKFFTTQEVEGRIPFVCERSGASSTGLTSPSKYRVFRQRITHHHLTNVVHHRSANAF